MPPGNRLSKVGQSKGSVSASPQGVGHEGRPSVEAQIGGSDLPTNRPVPLLSLGLCRRQESPRALQFGAIAQLGERWLCKPEVAGSNPAGSTSLTS